MGREFEVEFGEVQGQRRVRAEKKPLTEAQGTLAPSGRRVAVRGWRGRGLGQSPHLVKKKKTTMTTLPFAEESV